MYKRQEDDDKVAKVRAINAGGTQNIANVCKKLDCKMSYISTDYVFDGQGTEPWQPDCEDYKPVSYTHLDVYKRQHFYIAFVIDNI